MRHSYKKILPILLAGGMILAGCGNSNISNSTTASASSISSSASTTQASSESSSKESTSNEASSEEYFTTRDLSGEYDSSTAVGITLNGDSATATADNVSISGSKITIKKEGTYIISGNLNNGSIIVDAASDAKVQLVLNGVTIKSDTFAAIYVAQADKVFITLAEGTENELTNGGSFTQIDDNNVDAVIFSKDDLTFNGTGKLTITSPVGHGIVGKDDVTIADGNYTITSSKVSIRANEVLAIADGSFQLEAESDGIHAEDNDDDSVGTVYIKSGNFVIKAGDDGIHATTSLIIDGGTFNITAAEGIEATIVTINDGTISIEASDDGINAAKKSSKYSPKITVNGGDITVVMGSGDTDGFDANGDIEINGGKVNVTGNSTFDYDGTGIINGGTVIANGQTITSLQNQTMGGGRMGGGHENMGNTNMQPGGKDITGMTKPGRGM